MCVHLWRKAKAFYWGHELWDQTTLWNLSTIKTEQNEVHVPTVYDGKPLSALITFEFSAQITHTPGILTPGEFHPDRSGGHVVPRWKSPDVRRATKGGGAVGACAPPEIFKILHGNFDICRNFQRIKQKFFILIIFKKSYWNFSLSFW